MQSFIADLVLFIPLAACLSIEAHRTPSGVKTKKKQSKLDLYVGRTRDSSTKLKKSILECAADPRQTTITLPQTVGILVQLIHDCVVGRDFPISVIGRDFCSTHPRLCRWARLSS